MKNFNFNFPLTPSLARGGRKNFVKKKENFVCENCGFEVKGDGYTDHCPRCLWGKHVDREIPGDRASECRGPMEPIEVAYQTAKAKFKIKYRCEKCGHEFWVREGRGDNRELLVELGLGRLGVPPERRG